jgi:SAM-dependent methyltransferase
LLKLILNTIPRKLLIKLSLWLKPLLILFYKGNRFTDPIDGHSYRKFLPYGYVKKRDNVLAPGTLSLERHRLLWLYLQNRTDFFIKSLKVLHIAPEQAFFQRFKNLQNIDYTTSDLESPIADVKADITDLPFENESFDVILCNHVLEHIPDDEKAMKELYRVLKKGGWGIFQVPLENERTQTYEDFSITDPKERTKHFGQYDHVRVYGIDYFDRLKKVGFQASAINYTQELKEEEIEKYRLVKGELIPLVTK